MDIRRYTLESLRGQISLVLQDPGVFDLTIAENGTEEEIRGRLSAPAINPEQALYVSAELPHTARVMVKDEDMCVHCGLCAERCPTGAWDMQKSEVLIPYAVDEAAEAESKRKGSSAA